MAQSVFRSMILPLLTLTWLVSGVGYGADQGASNELRVMSYNILRASDDSQNNWGIRKGNLVADIKAADPDLLGVQEAEKAQMDYLVSRLSDYAFIGVGRDDGKDAGEFCAVFYKKEKFDLLDSGTFWLSETPEVPGKKGWDAMCNRVVTWGKFRSRTDGKTFVYANTHFDHRGETARRESAKKIVSFRENEAKNLPFFVTGDFNANDQSPVYKTIVSVLTDARKAAKTKTGGNRTFQSKTASVGDEYIIDYLFVSDDFDVNRFAIHSDPPKESVPPSDHYSIDAVISWK